MGAFARAIPFRAAGVFQQARLVRVVLLEVCLVLATYELYSTLRWVVAGDAAVAVPHGWRVLHLEQWLGLAWEQPLQHAVLQVPGATTLFNYLYLAMHRPFLLTGAIILFCCNRPQYYRARTAMLLSFAAGILIFWLLPVAPPRLLPGAGFVDTIHLYTPDLGYDPSGRANQFAAIPSFHVGWNALVVYSLCLSTRRVWVRCLLAGIPLLMLTTVVVTANHFWLDAAAGLLVITLCYQVAGRLHRTADRVRTVSLDASPSPIHTGPA